MNGSDIRRERDGLMDKTALREFIENRTGGCRILVVGDVMLDTYFYGEVTRISPEAPVPVTHVIRQKDTLGGAANVAHNLALLGCKTYLAGFVGKDHHCDSLLEKLNARGIDSAGLIRTEAPTTTKIRVIGGHQQMLRLDFEDASPVAEGYADELQTYVAKKLKEGLDVLIISDYGKGACTESVCRGIIELSRPYGVPVIVDPKGIHWQKYAKADYITPNLKEVNQVLSEPIANRDPEIERAARYITKTFDIRHVLATRSECGLSLAMEDHVKHIPTKAQEVFDVSGAGDTVIAVFALALAGGLQPEESAYLANLAASVVVAKLGTYAVSREELLGVLK